MVKRIEKTYTLQAPSSSYFAAGVTGAVWPLTTHAVVGGQAYKIALLNNTATDHSAKTVIFTGLDQDGRAQSETINMPAGNATVFSSLYYSSLITAVPSTTIGADTMNIGFTSQFSTRTIPTDYGSIGAAVSIDFASTVTINYTLQSTLNNVQKKTPPFSWQNTGAPFIAATTPQQAPIFEAPCALRTIVASYSGTPTFSWDIVQQGNRG